MDRDKVTKASAQIGFIKFVLVPLFESLSKVSYQVMETFLTSCLKDNKHTQQTIIQINSMIYRLYQLFPQINEPILTPLREAYEHYELLRVEEEKSRRDIDYDYRVLRASSTPVTDENGTEDSNEKSIKDDEASYSRFKDWLFLNSDEKSVSFEFSSVKLLFTVFFIVDNQKLMSRVHEIARDSCT
jgi:hypothetical protein